MAVGSGISEIPDSEEEPLTSSPDAALGGAVDKLYSTIQRTAQGTQDTLQDVANPDQATFERIGDKTTDCAGNLTVDQQNASLDDQASPVDRVTPDVQSAATILQQAVVETSSDRAHAQTETSPQLKQSTISQQDLSVPQMQVKRLGMNLEMFLESGAPAAKKQCIDAVGSDLRSDGQTSDAPFLDDSHPRSGHGPFSGLAGDDIVQDQKPDQGQPSDDGVRHDKARQTSDSGNVSLEPDHSDKSSTASTVSDTVTSPIEHGAGPVEVANTCVGAQTQEKSSHDDVEHLDGGLVSEHATIPPLPDTAIASVPSELQFTTKSGDSDMQMRENAQTPTIVLQQTDQSIEGFETQDENSISLPNDQTASNNLSDIQDTNLESHLEASNPIPETPAVAPTFVKPSKTHQEPSVEASATRDCSTNDSDVTSTAESKAGTQNDGQQTNTGDQQSLDDTSLSAITGRASELPGTPAGELLAEDKAGHDSEQLADATNTSAATDQSEMIIDSPSISNPQPQALPPPPPLTPQEITLAELKAQRASLLVSLATLPAIRILMEEKESSDVDMSDNDGEPTEADIMAAVNKIVKDHIKLLHEYNELKDVGQGLMGLIADQRGVRIVEVQDEFGIDAND